MRQRIIGVMGPGESASSFECTAAFELGQQIAQQGWILLTGGRASGVMEAASRGAKSVGGLTIGILPGHNHTGLSDAVDIAIVTDLGNARNNVNVLSSDVVIACGIGSGTVSEITLALKSGKPVILLNICPDAVSFLQSLTVDPIYQAQDSAQTIECIHRILTSPSP